MKKSEVVNRRKTDNAMNQEKKDMDKQLYKITTKKTKNRVILITGD